MCSVLYLVQLNCVCWGRERHHGIYAHLLENDTCIGFTIQLHGAQQNDKATSSSSFESELCWVFGSCPDKLRRMPCTSHTEPEPSAACMDSLSGTSPDQRESLSWSQCTMSARSGQQELKKRMYCEMLIAVHVCSLTMYDACMHNGACLICKRAADHKAIEASCNQCRQIDTRLNNRNSLDIKP